MCIEAKGELSNMYRVAEFVCFMRVTEKNRGEKCGEHSDRSRFTCIISDYL